MDHISKGELIGFGNNKRAAVVGFWRACLHAPASLDPPSVDAGLGDLVRDLKRARTESPHPAPETTPQWPDNGMIEALTEAGTSENPPPISAPQPLVSAPEPTNAEAQTTPVPATPVAPVPIPEATPEQGSEPPLSGDLTTVGSEDKKKPTYYFEFAKRKWETEETFRLPDGTFWPQVIEGVQNQDHGIVYCRLCKRHNRTNTFAYEGYRKGKRSALVDHQSKNKEHKQLVAEMESGMKHVMLMAGTAQRLQGKVAIVTGGGKGIGLACASCLGHEGCKIVVADIDDTAASSAVTQLLQEGIVACAARCDVTKKTEVDRLVAYAVQQYGALDILVANAGIVKSAEFLEMTESDFDDVINVNLKGVFLCGQAAARQMVAQNRITPGRGGAIVNMSSVNAVMAIPSIAAYNASKGGVNNLTRCMALALAPHKIRVNAIGPGSIMTEVLNSVVGDKLAMNRVLSRTPMNRVGDPYEIGQIAAFLASEAASYVTGQVLYADGGRMALNYTCPVSGGDQPAAS
ncbi:probable 5-keto-D-gluconate 5-reductase at C-terminar half [Coccomyxa sp. Obi]|nr:probable 5-keto-D-gluconate 5-reductase at C-terminar half [Coccomyxa sp. Obi]